LSTTKETGKVQFFTTGYVPSLFGIILFVLPSSTIYTVPASCWSALPLDRISSLSWAVSPFHQLLHDSIRMKWPTTIKWLDA
jgi:hypothetical protein